MTWFTGVWPDGRIEHVRSVTEYDRDGDAQQILREPVVAARPAASEERAAGLARRVALPRKTLLTMARRAKAPEPHITRTPFRVDSRPDQELWLRGRHPQTAAGTLVDCSSPTNGTTPMSCYARSFISLCQIHRTRSLRVAGHPRSEGISPSQPNTQVSRSDPLGQYATFSRRAAQVDARVLCPTLVAPLDNQNKTGSQSSRWKRCPSRPLRTDAQK